MKIIIDISDYDREWIHNAWSIPQELDTKIAEAIVNGVEIPDRHGRLIDGTSAKRFQPCLRQ